MTAVNKFDLMCFIARAFRTLVWALVVGAVITAALAVADVELWRAVLVLALPCTAYLLAWGANAC